LKEIMKKKQEEKKESDVRDNEYEGRRKKGE
jgi:hypothetical protein